MGYTYNNGTITQHGIENNLYGLSGSVTTDDFIVMSGSNEIPGTEVTIKGVVTLSNPVTLTGNGTSNINSLISAHNNTGGSQEIKLMSGNGGQIVKLDDTITIPAGMTNVVTNHESGGYIIYDMGNNKLVIKGAQYHDPEQEQLLFRFDGNGACIGVTGYGNGNVDPDGRSISWGTIESWSKDSDGNLVITDSDHDMLVGYSVRVRSATTDDFNHEPLWEVISSTSTTFTIKTPSYFEVPTGGQYIQAGLYHYGRETTSGTKTRTSRGDGIICIGDGSGNWNPNTGSLSITGLYGMLKARGGSLVTSRQLGLGSTVDIQDLTLMNINIGNNKPVLELRSFSNTSTYGGTVKNLQYAGFDIGNYQTIVNPEFSPLNGALIETLGNYYSLTLNNFDTTGNVGDNDIGRDSPSNFGHRFYKLTNPVLGSNISDMWRKTRGSSGAVGVLETWKTVKPKIVDTDLNGIEGVKIFVKDNPSQYAKRAYFNNIDGDYKYGWHKITSGTSSVDPVVTVFNHGLTTGDVVVIRSLKDSDNRAGKDIANGRKKVTVIDSDTFSITQVDGTKVIGNVAQQLLQSTTITNITGTGGGTNRIKLTVSSDLRSSLTAATNGNGSRVHINGVVGGADLTAVLNDGHLHNVFAITATEITLTTLFPSGTNSYTSGGTVNEVSRRSVNHAETEYDYRDNREYLKTTDATGDVAEFDILTSTQVKEYGADEPAASVDIGGPWDIKLHNNGAWQDRDTDEYVSYGVWDTDKFDGFYKSDRRGDSHATTDDFTFSFCSYDHLLSTSSQELNGKDTLEFQWVLFADPLITDTRVDVDAYTKIDTPQRFYNKAKAYLVDDYSGEGTTIVSRDGNTVNIGYKNLIVDSDAGLAGGAVFDYTKSTPGDITDDTTNQTPVVVAVGTGSPNASHPVDHIINNDTTTQTEKWLISNAGADSGVQISDLNSAIVTGLKITSADQESRDPRSYELYGSNNGTTWTLIHSRKIPFYTSRYDTKTFNFKNTSRYTQYKVLFPTIRSGTTLAVQELELVGVTIEGTITIETDSYIGNVTTTDGTITLENDAEIIGSYGDISVLPFTITNVIAGSTVQLYNVSEQKQISNDVVPGTVGQPVTYSGTYANSLAEPDDEVRLRITCAASDGAFLPYETFGVASTAGISFKANQVADTIYNDNAVDGSATNYDSTSLTIAPDYTNFELDISDDDNPGSVTVQQIYAKYAYLITTTDGIDKFFGAITAENTSNYRINTDVVDLKIQNISSSDIIITGARLYRDDNTTIIRTGYVNNDQNQGRAGSLSHDTGEFLQYIQPQVEAALNGYGVLGPDDLNAVKKNTNLIPGLL